MGLARKWPRRKRVRIGTSAPLNCSSEISFLFFFFHGISLINLCSQAKVLPNVPTVRSVPVHGRLEVQATLRSCRVVGFLLSLNLTSSSKNSFLRTWFNLFFFFFRSIDFDFSAATCAVLAFFSWSREVSERTKQFLPGTGAFVSVIHPPEMISQNTVGRISTRVTVIMFWPVLSSVAVFPEANANRNDPSPCQGEKSTCLAEHGHYDR